MSDETKLPLWRALAYEIDDDFVNVDLVHAKAFATRFSRLHAPDDEEWMESLLLTAMLDEFGGDRDYMQSWVRAFFRRHVEEADNAP